MALRHLQVLSSDKEDESAQWLSQIIQEMWPYAANVVYLTIMEYVQPALEVNLSKLGLPVPRFSKIDIGDDAVVIERVSVFERKYSDTDSAPVLEADIVYDGNPEIEMRLGDFTFGVTDAKIKGRVEILLRPLLGRIPLIGASQVGFVNPPKIDYSLTGVAAYADVSLIKDAVHRVVDDVLASMAVLPNRVAYKVDPDTDYFDFVAKPVGVLRVAALCGTNFPNTDKHILKQAIGQSEEPDVYLTLQLGSKVHETVRIDDRTDPVWENQVFDYVLTTESPAQQLQIEAYDYDLANKDDFLGRANVLVSDLIKDGACQIDLQDAPEDATPTVKLVVRWLPLSSELRQVQNAIMTQRNDKIRPKHCSSLLLSVEIDEARNLPPDRRPYVRVRIGPHQFQTNAAYEVPHVFSVENPDFEQSFHIPLEGPVDAGMQIVYQVLDYVSGLMMGYAYSSLSEAVKAGPAGKTYKFALLKSVKPNASLRVRVRLAAVQDQPPLWEVLAQPGNVYQEQRD